MPQSHALRTVQFHQLSGGVGGVADLNNSMALSRAAGSESAGSVPAAEAVYRDSGCQSAA